MGGEAMSGPSYFAVRRGKGDAPVLCIGGHEIPVTIAYGEPEHGIPFSFCEVCHRLMSNAFFELSVTEHPELLPPEARPVPAGRTTEWLAFPEEGSFFRLLEGTLQQAPMLSEGGIDAETVCDVDFGSLEDKEYLKCRAIEAGLNVQKEGEK
jgi:hypothetical protein